MAWLAKLVVALVVLAIIAPFVTIAVRLCIKIFKGNSFIH